MEDLAWVALALGIIVVLGALMALGWRNRLRRQGDVPAPPEPPEELGPVLHEAEGQYVATTTAGDWLDRIAVHGLGLRGNAVVAVHADGVVITRTGARTVFVPRAQLVSARLTGGMTGKFVEKDGLVVMTWLLGTERVDTGFRTRHAAAKGQLLAAIAALVPAASPHQPDDTIHHRTPPTPEGREQL